MLKNGVVQKAVIPVAGLGTRMLPATKAIPKEMLPIVDTPLIQYVVNEAIAAGIREIVLVTHASKNAIENHFDTSFELETQLEKRRKRQVLDQIRSIVPKGVTIISVRQAEAKGLGHAITCARSVVGDNPFAVLLPDVLVDQYYSDLSVDNLAAMVKRFEQTGTSQIMVEPVADDVEDVEEGASLLEQGAYALALTARSAGGAGTPETLAQRILRLTPDSRRRVFVVLMDDGFATGDGAQAWAVQADLVVNSREVDSCDGVIRATLQEKERLYQPYLDAGRRIETE